MPVTSRPSTASISGAWKTAPARPKPAMPARRSAMQQGLQHTRLAGGVGAAETRRPAAGDRAGEVGELARVGVDALERDALPVGLDRRLVAVPWVGQREAPLAARHLECR